MLLPCNLIEDLTFWTTSSFITLVLPLLGESCREYVFQIFVSIVLKKGHVLNYFYFRMFEGIELHFGAGIIQFDNFLSIVYYLKKKISI